jgi:hypothetical protein
VAGGTAIPISAADPAGAAGAGTSSATTTRVVQATSATGTKSNVSDAATSTTLLAANTGRMGAIIKNDSTSILYVDLSGGTASATSYSVDLQAGDVLTLGPGEYNGLITGIWSADASGAARVTEFT